MVGKAANVGELVHEAAISYVVLLWSAYHLYLLAKPFKYFAGLFLYANNDRIFYNLMKLVTKLVTNIGYKIDLKIWSLNRSLKLLTKSVSKLVAKPVFKNQSLICSLWVTDNSLATDLKWLLNRSLIWIKIGH
jgi:hypothetical protein